MCGIAGFFRRRGPVTADEGRAVERMLEVQVARGPDGAGCHGDARAVLGHRRLAIIDLSPSARQPMPNEDGTVWLTYNGEIYNFRELRDELVTLGHRFRSSSDSEVVIHGYEVWGVEPLLERLRGMYAFALYDAGRERLVLARDRLGIKPLYYTQARSGDSIAFASEVRALVAGGFAASERDPSGLLGFLALGSVPAPLTIRRDVACLPPGHYLAVDPRETVIRPYWRWPAGGPAPASEWADRVGLTLREAVSRHLVSDVPLGVFLSGGVDSAALVALASDTVRPLHTLTVGFRESAWDETPRAREVADRFGTAHDELPISDDDFVRELPAFFAAMDQPTHDGVNTYFVARAARKAGLTVVLSGAGADEVFWGYPHYRRLTPRSRLARWLGGSAWARSAALLAVRAAGRVGGREQWARLGYLGGGVSPERLYLGLRGFFAPHQIARLLGMSEDEVRRGAETVLGGDLDVLAGSPTVAAAFNRIECRRYLHDQLLRDTDVFGMAHSVEVRVPYLDHPVVEAVARLPDAVKLDPRRNKPVLCQAVGDPGIAAIAARPKRGFSFPMAAWMRRHAGVLEDHVRAADGLEPRAVRRLWHAFRTGRLHWSRAWALVVLGASAGRTPAPRGA
jgi:asparagine synthase (glutamine-hydrolysing)